MSFRTPSRTSSGTIGTAPFKGRFHKGGVLSHDLICAEDAPPSPLKMPALPGLSAPSLRTICRHWLAHSPRPQESPTKCPPLSHKLFNAESAASSPHSATRWRPMAPYRVRGRVALPNLQKPAVLAAGVQGVRLLGNASVSRAYRGAGEWHCRTSDFPNK